MSPARQRVELEGVEGDEGLGIDLLAEGYMSAAFRHRPPLARRLGRPGSAEGQPGIGRDKRLRRRKAAWWEPRVEFAGTEAGGGFTVGFDEDSVGFLHLLANRLGSGVDRGSR